ncbi:hypothetical protein ABZ714_07710 [Streptomyces sp. NPDC006798]|uniref:hypothetical protein n=1 Tax=Streptomyces sp. NPDC006798 TaxID=3155462 RepID=UPI0033C020B2
MSPGEGVGAAAGLGAAVLAGLAFLTVLVQGELSAERPPDIAGSDTSEEAPDSYD